MKKQAFNPYLPSWEYVPDGEPYVFDGRVYVYGSHDRFNGDAFCLNDYVCWSADVNQLGDWRYEGVIYRKEQDPGNKDGKKPLYAPDVQKGLDGKYYLYYCVNGLATTAVAVCDQPAGNYEFLGYVSHPDQTPLGKLEGDPFQFDPAIFIDDDERIFLYTGFAPWEELRKLWFKEEDVIDGSYCIELERDMVTVKSEPVMVAPGIRNSLGSGFEGHEFFEASSMRKMNGKYYLIYSSVNSHELCYAIGDRPDGKFVYGGTLVSNGDIFFEGRKLEDALNYTGNTHGSLVLIKDNWYVFYHRQTNKHQYSRQAVAEKITMKADGSIEQVEMTSCGMNGGALSGKGVYPAYIACNLLSQEGAKFSHPDSKLEAHPCFTQDGGDRESGEDQYIANICNGALAGFKYFDLRETTGVGIKVRGNGHGVVKVLFEIEGEPIAEIKVNAEEEYRWFETELPSGTANLALYFRFEGSGYLDFAKFGLW